MVDFHYLKGFLELPWRRLQRAGIEMESSSQDGYKGNSEAIASAGANYCRFAEFCTPPAFVQLYP